MNPTGLCTYLEWDTNFFGVRIARALDDVLSEDSARLIDIWCQENCIDCLYLLARSDNLSVTMMAEKFGYSFVDIRVTYVRDVAVGDIVRSGKPKMLVRLCQPEDLSKLCEIAHNCHTDSRFYFDVHFPTHLCNSLYETWLIRSCEGYADAVFVASLNGVPVGYITCHLDEINESGNIGLLGVDERSWRIDVGRMLIDRALNWFAGRDIHYVSVVTQGRNIGAQHFYQKQGFRTSSVMLWYHKWYSRGHE
jgi:ribosomal protein S18 acetylase RimI-like enzyme